MEPTFPVFAPVSPQAESIRNLFVEVLIICGGVFAVVSVLICIALWRFRDRSALPTQTFGDRRKEIYWLAGPVVIVLWIGAIAVKLILTLNAMPPHYAGIDPRGDGVVDVVVTGHQWWWEVEYPGLSIVSANEIHVPIGKKLRVEVRSDDVIHCFWVPQVARKIDAIPGQENYIWLEANEPGVYQGRCAEFCGTQHAWMNFQVIAHAPEDYQQWQASEGTSASAPEEGLASAGAALFAKLTCSQCHAVSGTAADQDFAPDLTHVASRRQLGAGAIDNSAENLRKWLADPQSIKPGCKMPNFELSDVELDGLVAYLETRR
jgi:cytochrome c oxidase subunit 2